MSNIGTFGSFTTARLGMYAAQSGLSVTGNNIANINTVGYTRQALNQASLRTGGNDRYQSRYNLNIGSGVLCVGVSQLRDPYLDIRYRTEMANVGALDSKLSGLDDIASILDEVSKNDGDGVLEKQLTDLMQALQNLSTGAGQNELDSNVRSAASTLAKNLNSYAKRLEEITEGTIKELRQEVNTVNGILSNIRDLNASIRKSEIHGDNALEQRDTRNRLIDELSQYIKIDVTYGTEDIGDGQTVEKLTIKMGNANPDADITTDSSTLVDGIYATQLLTPKAYAGEAADNPDSLPYEDMNGKPTSDPSKAAQEFNDNFDIILGALTSSKGTVQSKDKVKNEAIDPADYPQNEDDRKPVTVDDGNGTSITTSFFSKVTNTPAKVSGDATASSVMESIDLVRSAIAKAATAANPDDPSAMNGAVMISYTADNKFQLLASDGTLIGESGEIELPTTGQKKVTFKSASGAQLGSFTLKNGAAASDFANPVNTGLTYAAATSETTYYKKTVTSEYSTPVALEDNDLYGSIQSTRELLTEKGEFSSTAEITRDKNAITKRGIPYYQKMLDALANQIATQFNKANTISSSQGYETYFDENNVEHYKVAEGCTLEPHETIVDVDSMTTLTEDEKTALKQKQMEHLETLGHGYPVTKGGALFSNSGDSDDTDNITARNISVSHSWGTGDVRIVTSARPDAPSQANDNILHMISLFTTKLEYTTSRTVTKPDPDNPPDGTIDVDVDSAYFTGTFQEMLANTAGTLANDIKDTSTMLDNAYTSAVELDTSRDSVSSVDLNDEAMSMMQYQKSYSAACRLMTTLDETLDKLINGTGIAGR